MSKVVLVNPSNSTVGFSFMTPRWAFVLAQATPTDLVEDLIIVDETLKSFDPKIVNPGDIVGIGFSSTNCFPAYRVMAAAKQRGALVVAGGIHPTIFPKEPLSFGADAVVTGNGDRVWSTVVEDALAGNLQKQYVGGRLPGEAMVKANWKLLDPTKYMSPTVQTVVGCPENCSFCSVWITDGRQPRQRLGDTIIEEMNELHDLGFRTVVFADDNFTPGTLGRIARETSANKRKELEKVREDRLRFFDAYDRAVPKDMYAFTQMTSEVVSDPEYLAAMYQKMRVRSALIGIESFTEEGLKNVGKEWNPSGRHMVDAIRTIQDNGIMVLSSVICGLESDTPQTIGKTCQFLMESGSTLANFNILSVYPGTKDYFEMLSDRKHAGETGYRPKHKTRMLYERFWLEPKKPVNFIDHPNMSAKELVKANRRCWDKFYAFRATIQRTRTGFMKRWPFIAKMTYVFFCMIFKRVYQEDGVAADSVQRRRGLVTETLIKAGATVYALWYRRTKPGTIGGFSAGGTS
jgi:radical SAM superfamily enzyme YgiQ (UPF0313 family)